MRGTGAPTDLSIVGGALRDVFFILLLYLKARTRGVLPHRTRPQILSVFCCSDFSTPALSLLLMQQRRVTRISPSKVALQASSLQVYKACLQGSRSYHLGGLSPHPNMDF